MGGPMRARRWRWVWPACKILLGVAIVAAVGRQFYFDLQGLDLSRLTVTPGWLVLSGVLYLLALGTSAVFWYRLLRVFDQRPPFFQALRAYYLGLLGKYLPGKAWALLMRGSLVQGPNTLLGVAIITAFYEVFTTMAAGAFLAAVFFSLDKPDATDLAVHPVILAFLLVALLGVPLLPWIFNRLVERLARRFQDVDSFRLPRLRATTLIEGLAITGCGWVFFGLSLWSAFQALLPGPHLLTAAVLGRYVAIMSLAYVAGFLVLVVPSGVGVREYVLLKYLAPELARSGIAAAPEVVALGVLLLRLVWTSAEVIAAGVVYWFRSASFGREALPSAGPRSAETRG
jgi:uncharacterized membrane protein YbhN (UPF0104 family)